MSRHAYRLPFGAELLADGARTRFRFYAPAQRAVALALDDAPPQPMQRGADGCFERETVAPPGSRYRYRLDDGLAVPDPAARAQDGDVHGPSLVVDPRAYRWQHESWRGRPWHETVLYELHVGCCGGYRGVAARLEALAALGVTAIELMPLAEFPGARNWGYDGVLPYAPEASYGTPDQLKALIDTAHGLGLMVFVDVVYNHFGPDGNYLHAYAPDFFRADRHTPWGAAIDFRQRAVRDYFIGNALYWLLEYRIDGLRLDAVHAIEERDFLVELAARVRAGTEAGRHVHLVLENGDNDLALLASGYTAQWNDDAHHALHVLLSGEHEGYYARFAVRPAALLAQILAEGLAYPGLPPPGAPPPTLPPDAFVLFLQNHDQIGNRAHGERLITLAEPEALRAAVALQLLCPQIPLLFMGEEWGCRTPFLFFTDHDATLAPKVAAGRRAEFAHFAAFADPLRRERIPDPNAPPTFAQSCPDFTAAAHGEWQAYYRVLLALRRRELMPRLSGARSAGAEAAGARAVAARWRLGDGSLLTLVLQLGGEALPATLPAGRLLFESRAGAAAELARGALVAPACCAFLDDPRPESA
ncbi:malto-oligosyltrehalose trehalohydrolase [Solimonas flava]|uniref:malto-oligosyltrehalose trehalohydrolase n=1 Tax=Solimonas flava TaxID=415849 RepID=UPI00041F500F|nr:malto-oligosyltrehalose trehalohydrolase [Solimonas flava]